MKARLVSLTAFAAAALALAGAANADSFRPGSSSWTGIDITGDKWTPNDWYSHHGTLRPRQNTWTSSASWT